MDHFLKYVQNNAIGTACAAYFFGLTLTQQLSAWADTALISYYLRAPRRFAFPVMQKVKRKSTLGHFRRRFVKKLAIPGLFFIYFCLFKQTLQF